MQHTPGPWIIDTSHKHEWEGITIWNKHPVDTGVIAHVVPDQHGQEEANARLIALAPEMLEALRDAELTIQALYDDCLGHLDSEGIYTTQECLAKIRYATRGFWHEKALHS